MDFLLRQIFLSLKNENIDNNDVKHNDQPHNKIKRAPASYRFVKESEEAVSPVTIVGNPIMIMSYSTLLIAVSHASYKSVWPIILILE